MTEETSEKKVDIEVGLNSAPPPSIGYPTGNVSKPSALSFKTKLNEMMQFNEEKEQLAQKQEEEKEKDKERGKRDTRANKKEKLLNEKEASLYKKEKSLDEEKKAFDEEKKAFDEEIAKKVSDAESEAKTIISDAKSEATKIVSDAEKHLVKAKKALSNSEANKVEKDKDIKALKTQMSEIVEILTAPNEEVTEAPQLEIKQNYNEFYDIFNELVLYDTGNQSFYLANQYQLQNISSLDEFDDSNLTIELVYIEKKKSMNVRFKSLDIEAQAKIKDFVEKNLTI